MRNPTNGRLQAKENPLAAGCGLSLVSFSQFDQRGL